MNTIFNYFLPFLPDFFGASAVAAGSSVGASAGVSSAGASV